MRRLTFVLAAAALPMLLSASAGAGFGGVVAGGGLCSTTTGEGTGVDVVMSGTCFTPQVIRVQPGDTVTFSNRDHLPHTVTGAGLEWGSNDIIMLGATVVATFDREGVFPYMCNLHPGMVGVVVVGVDVPDSAPGYGQLSAREATTELGDDDGVTGNAAAAAAIVAAAGLVALVLMRRRSAGG